VGLSKTLSWEVAAFAIGQKMFPNYNHRRGIGLKWPRRSLSMKDERLGLYQGIEMSADDLTDEELLAIRHSNPAGAFRRYMQGSRHSSDKQTFLRSWINPDQSDAILECGSSSGKTSVDLARHFSCYCLGVDFDPETAQTSIDNINEYFPELTDRCEFECGDLAQMQFKKQFTKVLMPDFSEHIPDRVFSAILENLRQQLPGTTLYIYTPNRSHIFEIMKHRNFILKNSPAHINVKTRKQLETFLQANGWRVETSKWRRSAIPVIKYFESVLGYVPLLGRLFQRRIIITAQPMT
jgi:Methyltransferase domain